MSLDPHHLDPPGLDPPSFDPADDTRHEVYTRPTKGGVDTLLGSIWPGDDPQFLITGAPGSEQWVHARAFTACNVADRDLVAPKLRRVAFDAAGNLALPVPNAPVGLRLTPAAGGVIVAAWGYARLNEAAAVDHFNVYVATGGAAIDYSTPTLPGVPFAGYRTSVSLTFAHDTDTEWVVRSVSASGAEEANTDSVTATADAQAPAAPSQVTAEAAA